MQPTLAILSQVYVPDPTSVGQHMHDVACEMVRRGHRVIVFTSARGYDDPSQRYPAHESIAGVEVRRLPLSSFGKASIAIRLAGGTAFLSQALAMALTLPRIDRVLVSTSPPMCGLGGVALKRMREAEVTYWAMDLNPDQIVASGAMDRDAIAVRAFDAINRRVLADARHVVALDRYMAERLERKAPMARKLAVLPPWPLIDVEPVLEHRDNPFRLRHGFGDRRVVMYSGNLSPTHPVTTVLEAARELQHDPRLLFVFVGGGLGKAEIEAFVRRHALHNVVSLPYQPLGELRASLSAADVHLVAMGDAMVGIVHPCKVYGAMAVGRPVLVLGPEHSHLSDLTEQHAVGWHIHHGDVPAALRALDQIASAPAAELRALGMRARRLIEHDLGRERLCARFCDILES